MSEGAQGRIAILKGGHRFWVFAPVRGALGPLRAALELCQSYYQIGDHMVFLGSQIGPGGQSLETITTLVEFSGWLEAKNAEAAHQYRQFSPSQVVWLYGPQERLLEDFYTLYHAKTPLGDLLDWMYSAHNFDSVLTQFGMDLAELNEVVQSGPGLLAEYMREFRDHVFAYEGARAYFERCRRAAMSDQGHLLFVHGGVDPGRSLSLQTDAFWWGDPAYFQMTTPYQGFSQVVSGLTPGDETEVIGPGRIGFDAGAGRGGPLNLRCFDIRGRQLFSYNFS